MTCNSYRDCHKKKKKHCRPCERECKKECALKVWDTRHVTSEITGCESWRAGRKYLITGPIHVRAGATLYIEDGAEVLFQNGVVLGVPEGDIPAAALIFDAGSRLCADKFRAEGVERIDDCLVAATLPSNGGIFFCGSNADLVFQGYDAVFSSTSTPGALFRAKSIEAVNLGEAERDFNAVTLVGVAPHEWRVADLHLENSGNDGIQLLGSNVSMYTIAAKFAGGDPVDLDDSALLLCSKLDVNNRAGGLIEVTGSGQLAIRKGACFVMNGNVLSDTDLQWSGDMRIPAIDASPFQTCLRLDATTSFSKP